MAKCFRIRRNAVPRNWSNMSSNERLARPAGMPAGGYRVHAAPASPWRSTVKSYASEMFGGRYSPIRLINRSVQDAFWGPLDLLTHYADPGAIMALEQSSAALPATRVPGLVVGETLRGVTGGIRWTQRMRGLGPSGVRANAAERVPASPRAYSTLFEMDLRLADVGRSRTVHYNRANGALDEVLRSDAEMLALFESQVPGIGNSVARTGGRETPFGWTWEHASTSTTGGRAGVMRLVPTEQHTPGSAWWRVLHPDSGVRGGYSEWAIPAGAPKNR